MSFLTLFTADAAAAHGHEFSGNGDTNSTTNGTTNSVVRASASSGSLGRSGSVGGGVQPRSTISSNVSTVFEDPLPTPPPVIPRKSPRTKTTYHLAQPPPSAHLLLHRHSLKPSRNLVVQLQRLSNTTRPVPTLDVLPASIFASRLKATCGRFFKHGVGSQDLVFLASEEYGGGDEDDDDADEDESNGLNARHVVATVSQNYRKAPLAAGEDGKGGNGGMARVPAIRLDSGPPWEVTQTASGGYEFSAYQEDGSVVTARWNPRGVGTPAGRRRSSQTRSGNSEDSMTERKFQFSLVNPGSRKHPIIATLVRQTIEINDHYPAASLTSPVTTPTHSRSSSPVHDAPSSPSSEERLYIKTSDYIRMFTLASGIWVALREGLASSGNLHLDDAAPLSPAPTPAGRLSTDPTTAASSPSSTPSSAANRPRTTGRSSSCPVGPDVSFDVTPRSRLMRSGTMHTHPSATSTKHTPGPDDGHTQTPSPPRRSFSMGPSTKSRSVTTSHILRNLSSSSRTPSPTPRANATDPTTIRPKSPPTPPHRVPDQPLTPPTSGCMHMHRPRRGTHHHRHTNSASPPGSPAKYPEEKRRRHCRRGGANKDSAPVDAHWEWKRRKKEVQGGGADGPVVGGSSGVAGGKKRGRIRGFVDMLRRATSSKE
ncbi:unnamed protein product [Tuber melanosporum]|uniref:(Perigord truffle) hypothetical protein n=1 Tax=Tuber melanosporum (strain Mel28) TaxID=656061 RepID=D5GCA9_TUBMM|nr:uncharacterized protein GSTUM_00000658001 [Tuber melanosporum]CAZ82152.1 unnamed protein product [Tuber melanosporum]